MKRFGVLISFLENYNDQLRDLAREYVVCTLTVFLFVYLFLCFLLLFFFFFKASYLSWQLIIDNRFVCSFQRSKTGRSSSRGEEARSSSSPADVLDRSINLDIREGKDGSVYVQDLSNIPVSSAEEVSYIGTISYLCTRSLPFLAPSSVLVCMYSSHCLSLSLSREIYIAFWLCYLLKLLCGCKGYGGRSLLHTEESHV